MSRLGHNRRHKSSLKELGDFTTTVRVVPIMLMAVVIGAIGACVAWLLLKLIGFFTNVFYYQRLSTGFASPVGNHLGVYAIAVPVIGSLIVGLMARYGSTAIRGHGIPEAMEQVLLNESRIAPRVMVLKPLSAAIAIGTGGPFGAEGPIIATGGALGSVVGQILHTSATERKILRNVFVSGDRWFRTGDLLRRDDAGRLRIAERPRWRCAVARIGGRRDQEDEIRRAR